MYVFRTAVLCFMFRRRHRPTVRLPWSAMVIGDLRLEIGFHGSRPRDERVTVSYVALHPSFNSTDRSYDVALVRLSSPLDFGDQVRPVCLPRSSGEVFGALSECVVTGLAFTPVSGKLSSHQSVCALSNKYPVILRF